MKISRFILSLSVVMFLIVGSMGLAFAGAFGSPQGTECTSPPCGLKLQVQGAVAGTKLTGVISNEYLGRGNANACGWFQCDIEEYSSCAEADVVLRLKSGNTSVTLFKHFDQVPASGDGVLNMLMDEMKDEILTKFGFTPTTNYSINIADVQNVAQVDGDKCSSTNNGTTVSGNFIVMAEITLNVK